MADEDFDMQAEIPEGDYQLVPATGTGLRLNVYNARPANGTNVRVFDANNARSEVFHVSYRADGSMMVVNRWSGKSLDVDGAVSEGANVVQWADRAEAEQSWAAEPVGKTATVKDVEVSFYLLRNLDAEGAFALNAEGGASGDNVCVRAADASALGQQWGFLPVQPIESDGLYELLSQMDTRLAVAAASKAEGANVLLKTRDDGNDQKWALQRQEGGWWWLRNVYSGRNMHVANHDIDDDGENVIQWSQQASNVGQRWGITSFGTVLQDGIQCALVKLTAGGEGGTHVLDTVNARVSDSTNVKIWSDRQPEGSLVKDQRWVLVPTEATDAKMPVPTGVLLAWEKGGGGYTHRAAYADSGVVSKPVYATWKCTDAWASDGPNHYEMRVRRSYLDMWDSGWTEWEAWSAWAPALVYQEGTQAWTAEPLGGSFEVDEYRGIRWEIQVRSVGADGLESVRGAAADKVAVCYQMPRVTFEEVAVGPEGLRIGISTDYFGGAWKLHLHSVETAGGEEVCGERDFEGLSQDDSVLVPMSELSRVPADGETVTARFELGTPEWDKFNAGILQRTLAVSYDAGTVDVEPSFVWEGVRLTATVADLGDTSMWVSYDGGVYECRRVGEGDGTASFEVPYPVGKPYTVFTASSSADETQWGTDATEMPATRRRFHAWSWDGGSAYLVLNDSGSTSAEHSLKATYQAWTLSARPRQSVTYAVTEEGEFSAEGFLIGRSESSVSDFEALLEAGHAVYRSPDGGIYDVAVTSVDFSRSRLWDRVSVQMIEETAVTVEDRWDLR